MGAAIAVTGRDFRVNETAQGKKWYTTRYIGLRQGSQSGDAIYIYQKMYDASRVDNRTLTAEEISQLTGLPVASVERVLNSSYSQKHYGFTATDADVIEFPERPVAEEEPEAEETGEEVPADPEAE